MKLWDLDQMGYVDTMFGPQSEVTAVDALSRERAICAANDRTVRVWKYAEGNLYTQHSSLVCVCCGLLVGWLLLAACAFLLTLCFDLLSLCSDVMGCAVMGCDVM